MQEHLAATVALLVTSTLVVAAFASRFASDRIQDRYLFFLAPLLVTALLAWVALGAPRPVVPLALGVAVAVALVVAFPYTRFIGEPAKSDTFGLIPLWTWNEHLLGGSYRLTGDVPRVCPSTTTFAPGGSVRTCRSPVPAAAFGISMNCESC